MVYVRSCPPPLHSLKPPGNSLAYALAYFTRPAPPPTFITSSARPVFIVDGDEHTTEPLVVGKPVAVLSGSTTGLTTLTCAVPAGSRCITVAIGDASQPQTLFRGFSVTGALDGAMSISSSTVVLENMQFNGNEAQDGGAVHVDASSVVTADRVAFSNNTARGAGGAVFVSAAQMTL